mmetsp:Transcript_40949/g.88344  ORF Transcript_40949/g.88344 Transcript_40949/m.88344 type:complete len:84 (+) Transcript_40949:516-767(+)
MLEEAETKAVKSQTATIARTRHGRRRPYCERCLSDHLPAAGPLSCESPQQTAIRAKPSEARSPKRCSASNGANNMPWSAIMKP